MPNKTLFTVANTSVTLIQVITVGASLDLAAIAAQWPLVLAVAAAMLAAKSAVLLAIAPLAGVPRSERGLCVAQMRMAR